MYFCRGPWPAQRLWKVEYLYIESSDNSAIGAILFHSVITRGACATAVTRSMNEAIYQEGGIHPWIYIYIFILMFYSAKDLDYSINGVESDRML